MSSSIIEGRGVGGRSSEGEEGNAQEQINGKSVNEARKAT
jgi:hypothetical protein